MGKYDVVHIQLFACIVKEDDPAPLVKNLMSLLSRCVKVISLLSAKCVAIEGRSVLREALARRMSLNGIYANRRHGRAWRLSTMERC